MLLAISHLLGFLELQLECQSDSIPYWEHADIDTCISEKLLIEAVDTLRCQVTLPWF